MYKILIFTTYQHPVPGNVSLCSCVTEFPTPEAAKAAAAILNGSRNLGPGAINNQAELLFCDHEFEYHRKIVEVEHGRHQVMHVDICKHCGIDKGEIPVF